jgi:hypothetical protein
MKKFFEKLLGLTPILPEIIIDGPMLQHTIENTVFCSGTIKSKRDVLVMTYKTNHFSGLVDIKNNVWSVIIPLVEGVNVIVFSAIIEKTNIHEKTITINYSVPLTEKEQATKDSKPWINVLNFTLNTDNTDIGSFELDWNDIFIAQLKAVGYKGESEEKIVDQWFQNICRNILMENYEQDIADPEKRMKLPINKVHLGDGRFSVE